MSITGTSRTPSRATLIGGYMVTVYFTINGKPRESLRNFARYDEAQDFINHHKGAI